MATEDQHLSQFLHNSEVAQRLATLADYDWAVTALFYGGLHLTEAYLVRRGVFAETHVQRERQMLMLPELGSMIDSYRTLRDYSEDARYECRRFSQQEFEVIRDVFTDLVNRVQALRGTN